MKPHKHAELIKAWADGAEIQAKVYGTLDTWNDVINPNWFDNRIYRIKPEPKPDVVKIFRLEAHPLVGLRFQEHSNEGIRFSEKYIKCSFDGETGELKSAEVLK